MHLEDTWFKHRLNMLKMESQRINTNHTRGNHIVIHFHEVKFEIRQESDGSQRIIDLSLPQAVITIFPNTDPRGLARSLSDPIG